MFGSSELILILAAVLFIFGPEKIPELARICGKAIGDFKKAQRSVELGLADLNIQKHKDDVTIIYAKLKSMAEFRGFDTTGKTTEQLVDLLAGTAMDASSMNDENTDDNNVTA